MIFGIECDDCGVLERKSGASVLGERRSFGVGKKERSSVLVCLCIMRDLAL